MNVAAKLPESKFNDKVETDLCFFVKKDIPAYRKLMTTSTFPERCPIEPGTYRVEKMNIDLRKVPLLSKGLAGNATFTVHKSGKKMAIINVRGFVV